MWQWRMHHKRGSDDIPIQILIHIKIDNTIYSYDRLEWNRTLCCSKRGTK